MYAYTPVDDYVIDSLNRHARLTPIRNYSHRKIYTITTIAGLQEVFINRHVGKGVTSDAVLDKGLYLDTYKGNILTQESYEWLLEREELGPDRLKYVMRLSKFRSSNINGQQSTYIDATGCGSISSLFNHSCEPNCDIETVVYRGKMYIAIYTNRVIQAGKQLTYSYGLYLDEANSEDRLIRCRCGTRSCKRWINPPRTGQLNMESSPEH